MGSRFSPPLFSNLRKKLNMQHYQYLYKPYQTQNKPYSICSDTYVHLEIHFYRRE
jgi:hypothetical protein